MDGYTFDEDPARVDRDAVWAFLSTSAYWGRWRTREDLERQLDGAWRVVGCYAPDGSQVGFARAVSDGVALAYLADVYVLDAHRGRGLGSELVRVIVEEGNGAEFRWMLHTFDAHGLYARLGFAAHNETYLERPSRALRLRALTLGDEDDAMLAERELIADGSDFLLRRAEESFAECVTRHERQEHGEALGPGTVPASFRIADVAGQLVGRVSVRHTLNPALELVGGHIGYDVRPAFRRRGHATRILRHALVMVAQLGVETALVTCNDTNVGSATVIERCGGVLRDVVDGTRRYDVPTHL